MQSVTVAPVAVIPAYQRKGIGGLLIQHGLEQLQGRGGGIVIVVGHPEYYPRFGFSTALAKSFESPFPVEALMAMELRRVPSMESKARWFIHQRSDFEPRVPVAGSAPTARDKV